MMDLLTGLDFSSLSVAGTGGVGLFIIGRWLMRAEVVFKAIRIAGIVTMLLGGASVLGVVDINLGRGFGIAVDAFELARQLATGGGL